MLRNRGLASFLESRRGMKRGTKDEEVERRIAGKIFITRAYRRVRAAQVLRKFLERATIQDTIPHDNTERKIKGIEGDMVYPTVDDARPSYRAPAFVLFQFRNFRITYTYNLRNTPRDRSGPRWESVYNEKNALCTRR